jgi:microcystin-dependent protein
MLTPLALGTSASPLDTLTLLDKQRLLECGPLDLGRLNAILKLLGDQIDAVDAADNAIVSASYNAVTNVLTFTMSDGSPVNIDFTALIADTLATGAITGSSYDAGTNILTLTFANGTNVPIDMTSVIADAVGAAIMPVGGIIMWSGGVVPSGWHLCDGTGGTPDLRDRFVVGAGTTYAAGSSGGAATHDHGGSTAGHALIEAELPAHQHTMFANVVNDVKVGAGESVAVETSNSPGEEEYTMTKGGATPATLGLTGPTGTGDAHDHGISSASSLPPYYALAYIMKV